MRWLVTTCDQKSFSAPEPLDGSNRWLEQSRSSIVQKLATASYTRGSYFTAASSCFLAGETPLGLTAQRGAAYVFVSYILKPEISRLHAFIRS
jgi:hypothetical protein